MITRNQIIDWVVGHFKRLTNAQLMGVLAVVVGVCAGVGMATVKIEQKFVKDGIICAIINIKVAYLGGDMRPKQIPQEFISGLV